MIGALKRGLVFVHRWLGVALSAILMLWTAMRPVVGISYSLCPA